MGIEAMVITTTIDLEIKTIEEIVVTKRMTTILEVEEGDQDHHLIKREIIKDIDTTKVIKEEEAILGRNKEDKRSLKLTHKEVLSNYSKDFDFQ